ncbi:MAG: GNAT family N-acetyltransferase [Candidatus Nanoarchaeia archaeon]|nr:GNAT family N-acetyltransferase [Candidatus Nanoarchaeia archaeon]
MAEITFTSEVGLTREDIAESGRLAEQEFGMEADPDQIQISEKTYDWIYNHIPDCLNVIKLKGEVIGHTFIIPCSEILMNKFLNKEITENELFEKIKKTVTVKNFETIYLCAAFIKSEFRRQGLASKGMVNSIKKLLSKRDIKPTLFYWAFSEEGKKLATKIAENVDLDLKGRLD